MTEIRRARAEDATAVAHVHRSARAEAPHPRAVADEEWRRRLEAGDGTTLVWDDDGAVLGIAAVLEERLTALYVLPGVQGQGIGAALLAAAEGAGARRLEVYADNEGGRRFYERHGWILDGEDGEEARYRR